MLMYFHAKHIFHSFFHIQTLFYRLKNVTSKLSYAVASTFKVELKLN